MPIPKHDLAMVIHVPFTSRLYYCNGLYARLPYENRLEVLQHCCSGSALCTFVVQILINSLLTYGDHVGFSR